MAKSHHEAAVVEAGEVLRRPGAVVFDRVVLVRAADGGVVDGPVDEALRRAPVVIAWDVPEGPDDVRWVSAGTIFAHWHGEPAPLPNATGDPVADARLVLQLLRDVADRTAPISPRALFPHAARPLPSGMEDNRPRE